jgi:2-dehydro-3-deoxyphosphogluconate aldolase/(4S)-4-hydroxy-2-oxoglutarate aldolase
LESRLLSLLKEEKIIAIIRGVQEETIEPIAQALADGGIKFLEVTMNTEGALRAIGNLTEKFAGRLEIGAGTVLNVEMAKEAILAGAEYIISPNLDEQVIRYCVEQNVEVWPGTMTPSEIYKAYQLGAKAVKVFPIGTLGAKYIKEVKAPLNQIELIATGGVNLENISDFLKNGAIAVGLGGNLVDKQLVEQKNFEELKKRAQMFVERAKGAVAQ